MQAVMDIESVADQIGAETLDKILEGVDFKPRSPTFHYEALNRIAIGQLSISGYCFSPDEQTEKIYEVMKLNSAITEFTVIEDNTAVGFLTRTALNEILGGRFGFSLHSQNPIRNIMKTDFLKVDSSMPVDQVSRIAMQRPLEQLYNPIVVEQDGKYSGIVSIKELLDTCTKIALAERDEIALMKDSLQIGLFFMDRNYIIQDHYSRYLEALLLEDDLCGKSFPGLLSASVNAKELGIIRDYFEMIFQQTFDQSILDDINPFNELHYVNAQTGDLKVFHCDFTTIERNRGELFTLVAIYDITAKVELQQRLAEEEGRRQEEMKSVFELIQVEPRVFDDFLEDTECEFQSIDEILKDEALSPHQALVDVYQSVHAIKANAVTLGLNVFGDKVHNIESKIKKLRELPEVPFIDMLNLTMDIEKLSIEKNRFKVTIEKIHSFKTNTDKNQGRQVLVESLSKTANKVSADMGKKIQFIVEKIDDEAIKKGPRRVIKDVLTQLIRNSAVHGIETPEDRIAGGKNETGVIQLSVKLSGGAIHIKLSDDGCGLDYEKIAEKALRLNLIKQEDAENRGALLKVIFSPGFSTAETEGIHAGRGIGLNLVQDRVRKEKGSIKVQTELGKGTVFNIFFPLIEGTAD